MVASSMSQRRTTVQMNLFDFRKGEETTWLLPPWGYALGIGVNPLFLELDGRIRPIGTAFNLGGGVGFTVTAWHCIEEAIRQDPALSRRMNLGETPAASTLQRGGLYILRNYAIEGGVQFRLVALEHVTAGPPGDVVFCSPHFIEGEPAMEHSISFGLPEPDDVVHAVGYCNFRFPDGGIPLAEAADFDWSRDYAHEFRVVEGAIQNVFLREYAASYLRGPCFTFAGDLRSGMSGGPIFDLRRGVIFGMNSATAFDVNQSLGSLFFPYVLNAITFGANIFGNPNFRINGTRRIIDLLDSGGIRSDGSFRDLAYQQLPEGLAVSMPIAKSYKGRAFENFAGLQAGTPPSTFDGPTFVLRRAQEAEE